MNIDEGEKYFSTLHENIRKDKNNLNECRVVGWFSHEAEYPSEGRKFPWAF